MDGNFILPTVNRRLIDDQKIGFQEKIMVYWHLVSNEASNLFVKCRLILVGSHNNTLNRQFQIQLFK
jgi:hypothetical protein